MLENMWKKGELVWISPSCSDIWIPGRIIDLSDPPGVLVSFFGQIEPRYVSKACLRSFDRDFRTLVSDSWKFRRFVDRALRAHFWNISFGLWCSCQPPIDSPYFDRVNSLPWFPHNSDSALGYVRDMAISKKVPLWKLAETNSSSAQILSFRRYSVDFKLSESVYEEIKKSAKLMDHSEEPNWYIDQVPMFLEPEYADVENSRDLSPRGPLPKDIPCSSSPSSEQHVDKVVQICSWNTRKPLTNSDSSILKACHTMARTENCEDGDHRSKCQVEQSICLTNSEPDIEDTIKEDTTNAACPRVAVSGAPPDVITKFHGDIIGSVDSTSAKQFPPLPNARNDKAHLAKPLCFVVPGSCKKLLASYVKESYDKPRHKLDNSMISAKTLDNELSDRTAFNGTRQNCSVDPLKSHVVEVVTHTSKKELSSDDVGVAPAEQSHNLEAATTVENQTGALSNVTSNGVKRKVSLDNASARNPKRKKKAGEQSVSTDKPPNLHLMKDMRRADPKCLRMKVLSGHSTIPSKSELLKKFSVFGKIDASRTDVNLEANSAKIVFMHSIDAVTAYQFARSKKFTLARCKMLYRLDPFEEDNEVNKVPASQKPQESVPTPKSCLKNNRSEDKEERKGNLKVKFQKRLTDDSQFHQYS